MANSNLKYFRGSLIVTFLGLVLGALVGFYYTGTVSGAMESLFICAILAVLEVSISFDNAIVNATVLKDMSKKWERRFLTWGMLIAVFGMRLFFPLLIVALVGDLGPIEALKLAALRPQEYAQLMMSVHTEVSAFGGAFLMLVALKYFFDREKKVHWINIIEKPLSKMGKLEAIEVGITILIIYVLAQYVEPSKTLPFMYSGLAGILTFLAVEGVGVFLQAPEHAVQDVERASLGLFLYLEVLDASFSFDGVIGAFAITSNLFIITIGLGIGAMFVRSLTILMVEKGTLNAYKFLEHGAFYAVAALAAIMFLSTIHHVSEVITGIVGAAFIGFSIFSSMKDRRKEFMESLRK
ncbi:MAG: DUF475 domain-containing protein [Pseudobdellovibrionaceae bacterium]